LVHLLDSQWFRVLRMVEVSVKLLEIHASIKLTDLRFVAVEHQGLSLLGE
jgi:hypothetical protein